MEVCEQVQCDMECDVDARRDTDYWATMLLLGWISGLLCCDRVLELILVLPYICSRWCQTAFWARIRTHLSTHSHVISVFCCCTHDSHHKTFSRRKQYEPVHWAHAARVARLRHSVPVASCEHMEWQSTLMFHKQNFKKQKKTPHCSSSHSSSLPAVSFTLPKLSWFLQKNSLHYIQNGSFSIPNFVVHLLCFMFRPLAFSAQGYLNPLKGPSWSKSPSSRWSGIFPFPSWGLSSWSHEMCVFATATQMIQFRLGIDHKRKILRPHKNHNFRLPQCGRCGPCPTTRLS